jgi:MFS family permease
MTDFTAFYNLVLSYDFITQAIGIIASGFVILGFTRKVDDHLKVFMFFGSVAFAIHFFMLGAYAGLFISIINCFRIGFSIYFFKSKKLMIFFIGAYILTGAVVYETIFDLLPFMSSTLSTYSMYMLSGIKLRMVSVVGSVAWMIYTMIFYSIGGIITNIFAISMNLTTITRLIINKRKQVL